MEERLEKLEALVQSLNDRIHKTNGSPSLISEVHNNREQIMYVKGKQEKMDASLEEIKKMQATTDKKLLAFSIILGVIAAGSPFAATFLRSM